MATDPAAAYIAAVRALWGGDMELMRLVVEYGEACNSFAVRAATTGEVGRAEAAIREHIARHYVRRERLVPDEWDDLDATAPVETGDTAARGILPAERQHTLHLDDAGNVVSGAPDFGGDAD